MKNNFNILSGFLIALCFLGCQSQKRYGALVYNKEKIQDLILGEWERQAIDEETEYCNNSDRIIVSFYKVDNFKSDGLIDYFSYLSSDGDKRICYIEHGSESLMFYDIITHDDGLRLSVNGYLYSKEWNLKIIGQNKIIIDNTEYVRSKLTKDYSWHNNSYFNYMK